MKHNTAFPITVLLVAGIASPTFAAADPLPVARASTSDAPAKTDEIAKDPPASSSKSVVRIRTRGGDKGEKPAHLLGAVVSSDALPGKQSYIAVPFNISGLNAAQQEEYARRKFDGAAVSGYGFAGFVKLVDIEWMLGLALLEIESSEVEQPAFELSETWPTQHQRVLVHHGADAKPGSLSVVHIKDAYPWEITLDDGTLPEEGAPVTSQDGSLMGLVRYSRSPKPAPPSNGEPTGTALTKRSVLTPAEYIDAILRIQHPGVNEDLGKVIVGTAIGVQSAQFSSYVKDLIRNTGYGIAPAPLKIDEPLTPPRNNGPVAAGQPADRDPYSHAQPRPTKPATVESRKDEIKVFQLENAAVEEIIPTLEVLVPASMKMSAVPSQRTIIARGPADELEIVEAILLRLDQSRPAPGPGWERPSRQSDAAPVEPEPVDGRDDASGVDIPFQDIDAAPEKARQIERNLGMDPGTVDRMPGHAELRDLLDRKIKELAAKYNALMDERRFADAHAIAGQALELDDENPFAIQMFIESEFAYRKDLVKAASDREEIEILKQLKELQAAAERRGHDRDSEREIDGYVPGVFGGVSGWDKHIREGRHLSPKGLRVEFAEREAKARQVADRMRRAIESGDDAVETGDLRGAVTEAFDARQTLQRRELAELTERLAAIQQSLEAREQKKDEIINRRVQELLNPELEWESPRSSTGADSESDHAIGSAQLPMLDQEDGIPLAAAVKAFNRHYAGPEQPPLTEADIVEAISRWKDKRNDAPVSDAEFAAFLRIADTRRLRPGSELAAWTESTVRDGNHVAVAYVRLRMPLRFGSKGRTHDFVIREHILDDRTGRPLGLGKSTPKAGESLDLRKQSATNLKRIMLAFHNYHDVYGHFPPAMLKGKGNNGRSQHPHSWRVAILPFIEQAELYQQYDLDEPWNSPHNASLVARMPDVYRSPRDTPDSTNTSYFGVVSPEGERPRLGEDRTATLFTNPQGTPIRDISDGTSNTIAIVEAKRAVPWTKPEDIPFDVDGTVPALGGWFAEGFHAGLVDGSAKFVSKDNDEQTLRNLLLIQDGHRVEPKFVK